MKKTLFTFLLAASATLSFAQYTVLTTDPSGDEMQPGKPDIKSVSYQIDMMQDSIWFKIETHNSISPTSDFGLMIAIDSNRVTTDGTTWNGSNTSMKYDIGLLVFLNMIQPVYYGYLTSAAGDNPTNIDVTRPDNFTFIIRTKLSDLDNDQEMNLLVGGGAFDIIGTKTIFDNAPNTGYLTISTTTAVRDFTTAPMVIYPNPAKDWIHWEAEKISDLTVQLFSVDGKMLQSAPTTAGRMNIAALPPGIYFLKNGAAMMQIMKAGE